MVEDTRLLHDERPWMLFVDGENLTKRGQEVLKRDVSLKPGDYWRKDVFLWPPEVDALWAFFSRHRQGWAGEVTGPIVRRASRAYYYTSMVADEPEWTETRLALRNLGFEPRLFKRTAGKSKAVDIALATEALTLAAEQRYEVAVIFAGDGDYVPLVDAIKRIGLDVVVGFFPESGLSPELRIAADDFVELTQHFVRRWSAYEKEAEGPGGSSTS